jgi:O-antigen ligase
MTNRIQVIVLAFGAIAAMALFLLVERSPAMFANPEYLGAILAVQVALVGISRFEQTFFPLLMGTFLWAGTDLPFYSIGMSLRWLFLIVGAVGGFVIWIKRPQAQHFTSFHLVAFFCVISALVSALVSQSPTISLLKVASLFLLFLYASSGARVAVAGREQKFLNVLVLACEVLAYISAVCYFALGFGVFGNPNSLGAIIAIVFMPILVWGAVVAETSGLKQRRFFALALCGALLYFANSRAAILASILVVTLFTLALRRQRLLFKFAFFSVFFLTIMAVLNPSHVNEVASSFVGRTVFKESGTHTGVFGSRLSPWTETVATFKQHPWFGTGFGTSDLGQVSAHLTESSVYTTEGTNREHGNSYLALAEYLGLLGSVPFLILILMLIRVVARVFQWMRRTGSPFHPGIPFALVALSGLIHAGFEDWLSAVGSYLCVFFWVSIFILMDLRPDTEQQISKIALRGSPFGRMTTTSAAHSLQ